jgi:hypothetical protein
MVRSLMTAFVYIYNRSLDPLRVRALSPRGKKLIQEEVQPLHSLRRMLGRPTTVFERPDSLALVGPSNVQLLRPNELFALLVECAFLPQMSRLGIY